MIIGEGQPTPAVPEVPPTAPFTITYNYHSASRFHEAYVALNAVAAMTVEQFEVVSRIADGRSWEEQLTAATQPVMENGGTSLVSETQRVTNENTVDGKLEKPIAVWANEDQLKFLGQSLRFYARETANRVLFLASTGAIQPAYTRGIEGQLALEMVRGIEHKMEVPHTADEKPPFGFAAALSADPVK